jgi:hypothetical protein
VAREPPQPSAAGLGDDRVAVEERDELGLHLRQRIVARGGWAVGALAPDEIGAVACGGSGDRHRLGRSIVDDDDRRRRAERAQAAVELAGAIPDRDHHRDLLRRALARLGPRMRQPGVSQAPAERPRRLRASRPGLERAERAPAGLGQTQQASGSAADQRPGRPPPGQGVQLDAQSPRQRGQRERLGGVH